MSSNKISNIVLNDIDKTEILRMISEISSEVLLDISLNFQGSITESSCDCLCLLVCRISELGDYPCYISLNESQIVL